MVVALPGTVPPISSTVEETFIARFSPISWSTFCRNSAGINRGCVGHHTVNAKRPGYSGRVSVVSVE
ncbi:hypothetical protein BDW22DRAFT_1357799 [Trametopsis cervina]|nr:hypothetical protein BDW22DRAFT_1357799 [Trametopsis cervina]